jgi:hypothetical protein
MLIKVSNHVINTATIIDAKFVEKGDAATLLLRFPVVRKDGEPLRIKFGGENARGIWELVTTEAQELPYTGD